MNLQKKYGEEFFSAGKESVTGNSLGMNLISIWLDIRHFYGATLDIGRLC